MPTPLVMVVDDMHYLRIWVSRLRAKLERDPAAPTLIHTMPGLGYRLEAPPETSAE